MLSAIVSDIRFAVRTLRRARGLTMVAVAILGAGLALCASVATVVNAYLLRTLPYPESDRLFSVQYAPPGRSHPDGLDALEWRTLDDVIEHPIAWDLDVFSLRGAPHPEAAPGAWVTPGFIEGFGVRAALGRGFHESDFQRGRPQVALIGHRLWQARFGGDRSVVGRQFEAYVSDRPEEAETFTIIGVLPETFWHMNAYTEVLAPLRAPSYPYVVRLRAGVPPELAADRISTLVRSAGGSLPPGWRVSLRSAHAAYVAQVRPMLLAVAAATGLVLIIACANIAVLLLLRATERRPEVAIRKALGATTWQIARMLIAEALLLGAAATVLGLALGKLIVTSMTPLVERQLGRSAPGGPAALDMDWFTVLCGVVCGILTTCACMLAPLLASRRTPVALALAVGQRGFDRRPGSAARPIDAHCRRSRRLSDAARGRRAHGRKRDEDAPRGLRPAVEGRPGRGRRPAPALLS